MGGHIDPGPTRWEVGRDAAVDASRAALVDYARQYLAIDPSVAESLYCTTEAQLDDGIHVVVTAQLS